MDIKVAPDGKVWIATSSGAARFEPTTGGWTAYKAKHGLVGDMVRLITVEPDAERVPAEARRIWAESLDEL